MALAIAGVIALLSWVLRRARPSIASDTAGAIEPEKSSAWFTVIGGCLLLLVGLFGTLFRAGGSGALAVAVLGLCIAGFMSPSLTSVHRVTWEEEGIEGPSRLFGLTLGLRRTKILWRDVARAGITMTGYWFVESLDGRRVYWSYLYKGYGALTAFLHRKRPDLPLPFAA
ncbi:MAG: hypothetical protein E8A46_04345 [Bradyrhizobium sp.]|jgi:hypothetical protein|uniref:hypothetical protein n=1 Tax=Bradyrhizobium sp. TaxID=376 RepID=UPI00120C2ABC|nr:hypothetical protein [Bradyrhizobium sp.]THD56059.1 MAG: hypothetical protein E8A46_04345 [Bradyrhizobium sp.]